jgi:hypothetical protein
MAADTVAITAGSGTNIAVVDTGTGGPYAQIFTQGAQAATGSNVAASATSVTLLSASDLRAGASIVNDTTDSTNYLYVKMGTTASTTDYAVRINAGGYFEVPFGYRGRIDGIWVAASGNARVVEYTY